MRLMTDSKYKILAHTYDGQRCKALLLPPPPSPPPPHTHTRINSLYDLGLSLLAVYYMVPGGGSVGIDATVLIFSMYSVCLVCQRRVKGEDPQAIT